MKPFNFRTQIALLATTGVFRVGIASAGAEGIGWRDDGTGYGNAGSPVFANDRFYLRTEKHLV